MNIIQEIEKELQPLIVYDTGKAYVSVSLLERALGALAQCEFLIPYPNKQLTIDFLEWMGWDICSDGKAGYPPAAPNSYRRSYTSIPDIINNKDHTNYIIEGVSKLGTTGMVSEYDTYYSHLLRLTGSHRSAEHASPHQKMLAILKTVQPFKFNSFK